MDCYLEVAAAGGRQRERALDEVRAAVEVHLRAAEVGDAAGHGGVGRRPERVGDGLVDRVRGVGRAGRVRTVVRHVVHPRARRGLHTTVPGQKAKRKIIVRTGSGRRRCRRIWRRALVPAAVWGQVAVGTPLVLPSASLQRRKQAEPEKLLY
jgi:hypothetical protein